MKRAMAYVNVAPNGEMGLAWSSRERAQQACPADRIAECHELREGESILTAEMYVRIAKFAGSDRLEVVREVAVEILGILDGEKS